MKIKPSLLRFLKKRVTLFTLIIFCQLSTILNAKSFKEIEKTLIESNTSLESLQILKSEHEKIYLNSKTNENFLKLKLIEYYTLYYYGNPIKKRLEILLFLLNEKGNSNLYLKMICNYQLAYLIHDFSPFKSLDLMRKSEKIAIKLNDKQIEVQANRFYAGFYFHNIKDYKKSMFYWRKCLKYYLSKDSAIDKSSMLNNIALCYVKLGQTKKSIYLTRIALNNLKNCSNENEVFFKKSLKNNLGTCLLSLGKYKEANSMIVEYYEYCIGNEMHQNEIPKIASDLISINYILKNNSKNNLIIYDLKRAIKQEKDINIKYELCVVIHNYFLHNKDFKNIEHYSNLLIQLQEQKIKAFKKETNFINEQLTKSTIESIEKSFATEVKYERQKSLAAYSLLSLIILGGVGSFLFYRRNKLKNEIITEKEEQIEQIEQDLYEFQQKQQQEKLLALQMNINLKNATALAFAEKLKQLKRKKDINTEEVIKELQVQIGNLLSIDKKNSTLTEDTVSEKKKFNDALRRMHPHLTSQDLQLCGYYKMNLSAKEIATLEGITPGSAHVYKNKLKNKLGLKPDDNLNLYLKELSI